MRLDRDEVMTQGDVNRSQKRFARALKKTRKQPLPAVEIIGITDFVLTEESIKASDGTTKATNALTETVDSTSFPDKARIRLYNGRGFDVYLTKLVIDAKPIKRYNDAIVHDDLRKDDDIRNNGEKLFELGNEYVIDATQVDRLADYWWKYLTKKKHIYSVTIPGLAPWYAVGDWYTLTIGAASTNENINSTVECYDVQCERTAGGIGSTRLMLREVEEDWTKTTFYAARADSGGSPKRRAQQSNTMIVASSTFDGTYDYKCDGTDDDVEIQAAIDYVSSAWGGGTVQLTEGTYLVDNYISLDTAVELCGMGKNTIIKRQNDDYIGCIYIPGVVDAFVHDLTVDGGSDDFSYAVDCYLIWSANTTEGKISNITGQKLKISTSTASPISAVAFFRCKNVSFCVATTIECINTNTAGTALAAGFSRCRKMVGCEALDIIATANGGTSEADALGFTTCSYIQSCLSYTLTASSGTTNKGIGFLACAKLTNCLSENAAANSIGFSDCDSVQQCKSVSNASHYGTGATQSYADAASGNACADTSAGGYNS